MSDQAISRVQNAVLNEGAVLTTQEPKEVKSNGNAISLDELSGKETQTGENLDTVTSCCATSSSDVSEVTAVSVTAEETRTATKTSGSAQTSKGVIIRPITAASMSADKEYVFYAI